MTSTLLLSTLSASLILLISACSSKKENKVAPGASPEISVDALQVNNCLSVEKLVSRFNEESFSFPARKTTFDLTASWEFDQFFIYNFGITDFRISSFPFIRRAIQSDCSSVTLETAYGRKLNYRVSDYSKTSIHLVRDSASDPVEEVKVVSEAYKAEPTIKSIKIELESPTTISLSYSATTLLARCNSTRLREYSKGMRVRWASSAASFPQVETMDPYLVEKARRLRPVPVAPPLALDLLLTSSVAMAETPPEEELPPVETEPIDETSPISDIDAEQPPVAEVPESPEIPEVPVPTPSPAPPAVPEQPRPTTDQFSVQEILELQNSIRQGQVNRSCST